MAVDHLLLESLRARGDDPAGFRERLVVPTIGGWPTVGVLAEPSGKSRGSGWVICHSFGMEQLYLQPLDIALARALAAAGFPTLRYHGQGYGDSEGPDVPPSLGSHVRDAIDAVGVLRTEAEVDRIGLAGIRFGGAVAAVVAATAGAAAGAELIMVDPVVSGAAYLQDLVRRSVVTELADGGRDSADATDGRGMIGETGEAELQGFRLPRAVVEEMAAFDLPAALHEFHGEVLVVQVSRQDETRANLRVLADRLSAVGAVVRVEVVGHRQAPLLGTQRYRNVEGRKTDTQADLSERVVATAASWAREVESLFREASAE